MAFFDKVGLQALGYLGHMEAREGRMRFTTWLRKALDSAFGRSKGEWGPVPITDIEISYEEYLEKGCPVCNSGNKSVWPLLSQGGLTMVVCTHCDQAYGIRRGKPTAGDGSTLEK